VPTPELTSPPGAPKSGSSERESTQAKEAPFVVIFLNVFFFSATLKCCATLA
jgi:hypothetical protein